MSASTPRITALNPIHEDPCLITVMIDGESLGTAAREDLEASQVSLGMSASDPRVCALKKLIDMRSARSHAMGLLSRADFPKAGLVERLLKHGVDSTIANQVVQDILKDGWIDDESYARKRIWMLREEEGHSTDECRARLHAERVDRAVVERVIAGEDRRESEFG